MISHYTESKNHTPTPRQARSSWAWFHRFGSSSYFYRFATLWGPRAGWCALVLMVIGIYMGLFVAPPDYQMGNSYRIIFIHVPSAWMSLSAYVLMAASAAIGLIWKMKVSFCVSRACAPIGAAFTFCALITGSLWGKPTWGTYWIWDARLTSELVLLFLYMGYMALDKAISDRNTASQATAVLSLVGLVNIPIIHYSVEWWNTLHQGSTVFRMDGPSIDARMLVPLLITTVAMNLYFISVLLNRVRCELLDLERRTQWVREVVNG